MTNVCDVRGVLWVSRLSVLLLNGQLVGVCLCIATTDDTHRGTLVLE